MTANDGMLSVRLPADLAEALKLMAERDGTSASDVVRSAVMEKLGYCPTCKRAYGPG